MCKRNNVDMGLKIVLVKAEANIRRNGNYWYSIMRHMMNLESVITYEGTHTGYTPTNNWT